MFIPFMVDFPVFFSYFTFLVVDLTCEVNGSRALIGASILRSKWKKNAGVVSGLYRGSDTTWKAQESTIFFRQLWLVLGVKLMEINSNWFSRYTAIWMFPKIGG